MRLLGFGGLQALYSAGYKVMREWLHNRSCTAVHQLDSCARPTCFANAGRPSLPLNERFADTCEWLDEFRREAVLLDADHANFAKFDQLLLIGRVAVVRPPTPLNLCACVCVCVRARVARLFSQ